MKTSFISSLRGWRVALGLIALSSAYAGPGPQYWRNAGKPDQLQPTGRGSDQCGMVCADSKTVPVTELRNDWPNGRGPQHAVAIGTEQVCTMCGQTTTLKPDWPNGRGPLRAVTSTATHVCRISVPTKQG